MLEAMAEPSPEGKRSVGAEGGERVRVQAAKLEVGRRRGSAGEGAGGLALALGEESAELRYLGERGVGARLGVVGHRARLDGGAGVSGAGLWDPGFGAGGWKGLGPVGAQTPRGRGICRRVVERARRGPAEGPGSWPRWGSW